MQEEEKRKKEEMGSVFQVGGLSVETVEAPEITSPPKPITITTPTEGGEYPVILFFHGYCCRCYFYTQLLKHIASHGYIVVAPQLYLFCPNKELESASDVANWLSKGLQSSLPKDVNANMKKVALAGHSRGGRAAFCVALGKVETTVRFSALIGIDPVAGMCKSAQISPAVLTYIPHSFDLGIPVMVIGTGLGDEKKNCLFPPCAPDGVNHKEFYNECQRPCFHFVAAEYGHMDMLDDDPSCLGKIVCCMCKQGHDKDYMRRFVGGITVAFLRAYLDNESGDFKAIIAEPAIAPVKLDPIEYIE